MKQLILPMVLAFILLLPGFGGSGEIMMNSTGGPTCIDKKDKVICLHYFEKQKVLIKNFVEGLCDDLMVRLVQLGSRLVAEAGDPLILDAGFCKKKESIYLELPRIKRIAEFELQVLTKKPDQSWGRLKSFPILVYPDDLLKPLKLWAEKNLLLVKGKSETLISFLDKEKIPYSTRNTHSNGDRVILHVGDLKEDSPDYTYEDNRIIIFKEAVEDLPQIRAISTKQGPRIFVEMKLLNSLSESPLAQRSFMKIFRMALDFKSNSGG